MFLLNRSQFYVYGYQIQKSFTLQNNSCEFFAFEQKPLKFDYQ